MAQSLPLRIAAAADLHYSRSSQGKCRFLFSHASRHADVLVLGGDLTLTAKDAVSHARAGDFVVMEPGTQLTFSSRYGASLLIWADGPSMWEEGPASPELYGFTSAHGDPLRFGNRAPKEMKRR